MDSSSKINYRIDLSYDGSNFHGWQSQADGSGIQDAVEKVLAQILGQQLRVVGASRTDSGVHAEHQVAMFECERKENGIDTLKLQSGLQALLPKSIGVLSVTQAAPDFHPIISAKAKAYRYRLWLSRSRNPFIDPFVWQVPDYINIDMIRSSARFLLGKHDFRSFCAADSSAKTFERTMFEIAVKENPPEVDIWFLGDGFLKQMLRTIMGTFIDIGLGKTQADDIQKILCAQDRTMAGATAPAKGLTLFRIFYGEEVPKIP